LWTAGGGVVCVWKYRGVLRAGVASAETVGCVASAHKKEADTMKKRVETSFHTRRLRRDLLAKLHILKAQRNAERVKGQKAWRLDQILNEVLERGLAHTLF